MRLRFPHERPWWSEDHMSVVFRVVDGRKHLHFRVRRTALEDLEEVESLSDDECLHTFERFRTLIERTAAEIYESGRRLEDGSVQIDAQDLRTARSS